MSSSRRYSTSSAYKGNEEKEKNQRNSQNKESSRSSKKIFRSNWMNYSLNEARGLRLFRPIEEEIIIRLTPQFERSIEDPMDQQILFSLLGRGYAVKYFPHHKFDPSLLNNLKSEDEEARLKAKKLEISELVTKELEKFKKRHGGIDRKLLGYIREIFSSDLNAEIHKKLTREKKITTKHGKRGKTKIIENVDTRQDRSDFVQIALEDLLDCDLGVDGMVLEELKKRILIFPGIFRRKLFQRLYLAPVIKQQGLTDEIDYVLQYKKKIKDELKQEGISNISEWSGTRNVDMSAILAIERCQTLKESLEEECKDEGVELLMDDKVVFLTRILALAKLYYSDFSPTHIFWISRAVKYFPVGSESEKEENREISAIFNFVFFSLFSKTCIRAKKEIFKLAEEIYAILDKEENTIMVQIDKALNEGLGPAIIDPTMYSSDIIIKDDKENVNLWKRFVKEKKLTEEDCKHFADFRIFLRKWISEGFVGILSKHGLDLVWDYLYFNKFDDSSVIAVCLALFNLISPLLIKCHHFSRVEAVCMEGAQVLKVQDLRRVLKHLGNGGSYSQIPDPPFIPKLEITPPSANVRLKSAVDKRMDALSLFEFDG